MHRMQRIFFIASGATAVIALNTVGVVSDVRNSGEIAVPDQILDYTWGRQHTIHDGDRQLLVTGVAPNDLAIGRLDIFDVIVQIDRRE